MLLFPPLETSLWYAFAIAVLGSEFALSRFSFLFTSTFVSLWPTCTFLPKGLGTWLSWQSTYTAYARPQVTPHPLHKWAMRIHTCNPALKRCNRGFRSSKSASDTLKTQGQTPVDHVSKTEWAGLGRRLGGWTTCFRNVRTSFQIPAPRGCQVDVVSCF